MTVSEAWQTCLFLLPFWIASLLLYCAFSSPNTTLLVGFSWNPKDGTFFHVREKVHIAQSLNRDSFPQFWQWPYRLLGSPLLPNSLVLLYACLEHRLDLHDGTRQSVEIEPVRLRRDTLTWYKVAARWPQPIQSHSLEPKRYVWYSLIKYVLFETTLFSWWECLMFASWGSGLSGWCNSEGWDCRNARMIVLDMLIEDGAAKLNENGRCQLSLKNWAWGVEPEELNPKRCLVEEWGKHNVKRIVGIGI